MSKTILLTGGSSGIGQAIIRQLKQGGWQVIAPTRRELDLAAPDAVATYHFPADNITAFMYIAGIWHDGTTALADKSFSNFSAEQIIQTMQVGVTAPMLLVNRLLAEGQLSHVMAITGTFESGAKGWLPYYTSKRALEDFLVGLAQDNPDLRVYGISPADTDTPAYRRFYPEYAQSAQPAEVVAELVATLLKGQEQYASGSIIEIRNSQHKLGFHS